MRKEPSESYVGGKMSIVAGAVTTKKRVDVIAGFLFLIPLMVYSNNVFVQNNSALPELLKSDLKETLPPVMATTSSPTKENTRSKERRSKIEPRNLKYLIFRTICM
jgi:hypothetical protein